MASTQAQQQPVSDERKRKRMESNRESARRSRMRKQQHLEELMSQMTELQNQNTILRDRIDVVGRNFLSLDADNNVLRAQIAELTERFDSLNSLISFWDDDTNALVVDTLLEPWQLPCSMQPITDMLQF